MKANRLASILFSCLFLFSSCNFNNSSRIVKNGPSELCIFWVDWSGATVLRELVKDFSAETGIKTKLVTVPWDKYQLTLYRELDNKSDIFDLAIGDSQWLGWGVTNGHYIELTDWFNQHNISDLMVDTTVAAFSEYPKGAGRYWAIPVAADAVGFAYRADLFNAPKEKEAFRRRYGYDLDVPKTWAELKDIAEFFTRPGKGLYGLSIMTSAHDYDGITMAVDSLIWSWGAELGNYETHRISGILDSPESAQALEFYKQLYRYNPPGWEAGLGDGNSAFQQGKVAMVHDFFGLFPPLLEIAQNPYAASTGFFVSPQGPQGKQHTSIGGQGVSLVAYSKHKEEALRFLEWFIRDEVQKKFAELGGQTCHKKSIFSAEFLDSRRYHRAYADSLSFTRDFWSDKEYDQLLKLSQQYWREFVLGNDLSADQTQRRLTTEWEQIFEYAGYYKE